MDRLPRKHLEISRNLALLQSNLSKSFVFDLNCSDCVPCTCYLMNCSISTHCYATNVLKVVISSCPLEIITRIFRDGTFRDRIFRDRIFRGCKVCHIEVFCKLISLVSRLVWSLYVQRVW